MVSLATLCQSTCFPPIGDDGLPLSLLSSNTEARIIQDTPYKNLFQEMTTWLSPVCHSRMPRPQCPGLTQLMRPKELQQLQRDPVGSPMPRMSRKERGT